MHLDLLASKALSNIPKILGLLDRNRHSRTYGCFDRNFWHYRIIDFPSGMSQQMVLPLALVYALDLPKNHFKNDPVIFDFIKAGIGFAAQSAHGDGSSDDYFPFERAAGASAFSLYAIISAINILSLDLDNEIPEAKPFLMKRAHWLAAHRESGQLSNHEALIALTLLLASRTLDDPSLKIAGESRLLRALSWQHDEGWFQEYEGCDPSYLTVTIALLAQYHCLKPSEKLQQAISRAVHFVAQMQHPDGTLGGEYASRNMILYYPQGFELAGEWINEALTINDRFLCALADGRGPTFQDDRIIAHETIAYLLAWRDYRHDRPESKQRPSDSEGRQWFAGASLLVEKRGALTLYAGLNKGGSFKLFRGNKNIASDTQVSIKTRGKKARVAVGHMLCADNTITFATDEITVAGDFGWAKNKGMNTISLLLLRVFMLGPGRFCADCVRKLLQRILIVGRKPAPYLFFRRFVWTSEGLRVEDKIDGDTWVDVESMMIGSDQTSIYIAGSRNFQPDQLFAWVDLSGELEESQPVLFQRTFRA